MVFLDEAEAKSFWPMPDADVATPREKQFSVFVRSRGTGGWVFGCHTQNAVLAMACMNYVRRTKPYVDVKVLPRGAACG